MPPDPLDDYLRRAEAVPATTLRMSRVRHLLARQQVRDLVGTQRRPYEKTRLDRSPSADEDGIVLEFERGIPC
jgi:hypothetical protein